MSVAFTKEEDNEAAAAFLPERPISPHPNWVTARGLAELDAALAAAKEAVAAAQGNADLKNDRSAMARAMRDLRYFTARRASAELREPDGEHRRRGRGRRREGLGVPCLADRPGTAWKARRRYRDARHGRA